MGFENLGGMHGGILMVDIGMGVGRDGLGKIGAIGKETELV